ncbi:iron-siderophore ABC transporter substrate-binding protein [Rhizobium sp. EC-SD404]|uniref:iron-siderophore ABC transporter substrate-binding protein n=1 Tax=Rhizobium sp. EC-SD404 TaxID=2038389 RepID=UPI001250FB23|nr:iron-siderophore ABC transporter substrate-binding protein [Rhizobium sp. EC-SD404]VVT14628.1 ABC-type Fe3+-hydroxamate transport system, periplasmic component [Rhizobium sp. EC-SD404]
MRRAAWLLAVLLAWPVVSAAAQTAAPRVIAVDWGLAETLAAIGAPPSGLPEMAGYEAWVKTPPMPADTAELGLRVTPSLEFLAAAKPDVIATTSQFAAIDPILSRIAPTRSLDVYTSDLTPLDHSVTAARALGEMTGREAAAQALIDDTDSRIAALEERLAGHETKSVLMVSFMDDRHVRVFTKGSMFDDVMARAGLSNAWTEPGNFWGFALASIENLARMDNIAILIVEPIPESVRVKLADPERRSLLGQLPAFAPGNYRILPPVWQFGALPSAGRFADMLLDNADFLERPDAL